MIADADSSLARSDHIASTSSGSHESKLTSSIVAEPQVAETVTNHNDEDSRQVNQERSRLKRKQSLEAQVTSGCGGGKKKARIIDSFYGTLWPILERIGWKLVKGEGKNDGAVYFLPPGVTTDDQDDATSTADNQDDSSAEGKKPGKPSAIHGGEWECITCGHLNSDRARCKLCMGWKGGSRLQKPYLCRVREVIERVLKSSDETEVEAAEAYVKVVPDIHDHFLAKDKAAAPSYNANISTGQDDHINLDWKHQRTHYPKATSRVGEEYQVSELPKAGTHVINEQSHLCDLVWDWKKAEASGKLEFCTRVTPNKKAEAYEKLQQRGYSLPGFYQEVCDIPSTDGSDWTEEDKRRFRASIFKEQKSIIKVSKSVGKPMKQCMTYYYGTFKKSKDYPRLKLAIYRKNDQAVKTRRSNWICDTCGIGGKLIACDSCELHYHLDCLEPPLKEVPEGTWICNTCRTKTNDASDKMNEDATTDQVDTKCPNKTSINGPLESDKAPASSLVQTSQGSMHIGKDDEEKVDLDQSIMASIKNNDVKVQVVFRDNAGSSTNHNQMLNTIDSDMCEGS
ncbi:hypothetical protein ACHAXN_003828 [Cyclotella atomus]